MKKIIVILLVTLVFGLAYYAISPIFDVQFVDDVVDEAHVEEMSAAFSIIDTTGHPASGSVKVIEKNDGSQVIRFEDFETINGPQLHLYLSKDLDASEFIDLGPIRGTEGNINYDVPEGVDIEEYPYVMHWCVPFSVLFNYAELR
jgi:hypothetical protein